jgi:nitroimidazol reductase NimA-like FMN-containing flavoprotein (pyridoxamine 5'-phosphate oxidase superfamily)
MTAMEPVTHLDHRFSEIENPTPWTEAREVLERADVFWVSTVRPDGRPHVTPLIAVWHENALYFCTGPDERKAKNLAENRHCILTTGCNTLAEGLDVVVEGDAVRITDDAALQRIADAYVAKYGEEWRFEAREGAFHHRGGGSEAQVFEVAPRHGLGFAKGPGRFGQTRWRFEAGAGQR